MSSGEGGVYTELVQLAWTRCSIVMHDVNVGHTNYSFNLRRTVVHSPDLFLNDHFIRRPLLHAFLLIFICTLVAFW